jgi:hypothetical protein
MKLSMNFCYILAITFLFYSCNNNSNVSSNNDNFVKPFSKKSKINGLWISINDRIIKNIVISQSDSIHFIAEITFVDGSRGKEIILFKEGKYKANNKFGEYYKLIGDKLGSYDSDGLISTFRR